MRLAAVEKHMSCAKERGLRQRFSWHAVCSGVCGDPASAVS